jgi:hypothetical protein
VVRSAAVARGSFIASGMGKFTSFDTGPQQVESTDQ